MVEIEVDVDQAVAPSAAGASGIVERERPGAAVTEVGDAIQHEGNGFVRRAGSGALSPEHLVGAVRKNLIQIPGTEGRLVAERRATNGVRGGDPGIFEIGRLT